MPIFGCVADDFTGASDAASFLEKGGLSVQLFNGIPEGDSPVLSGIQAVVIALKSRTQNREDAVRDSLKALNWLKAHGVKQFYLKYCSTFDSTPDGNIGPVADAAMDFLQVPYTVLCPALPVNGRTVFHGKLYVNGMELQDSPMKDHPLTPMWASRIAELMKPQSKYSCVELWKEQLQEGKEAADKIIETYSALGKPFYIIPDYEEEQDACQIVKLFGNCEFLTGGSGLLYSLACRLNDHREETSRPDIRVKGTALLLAGSCSKATLEQIAYFKQHGGCSYKIDPVAILEGKETVQNVWKFIQAHASRPVLVYSSDTASEVRKVQQMGQEKIANLLEETAADLAERAVASGINRIIVAGGETSGAVTKRLGFHSYRIGESVAPGVPVMIPFENPDVRLVLKSGNFGQEDFFERVLTMTKEENR